ncbi:MAG: PucR family transcriptional regulator [Herpetosiphon sp.]
MLTIRDLQRLALPPGTLLRTGERGGSAHVRGVVGLRPTLPAFAELHSDDVTLIVPSQAISLDPRLTLSHLVDRLAEVPVAGIAVAGVIPDDVVARADRKGLALLEMPSETDVRHTEREILRLLSDPDLQIERRAAQLYSELTQALVAGGGIRSVVALLADRTGQSVACYSSSGRLRADAGNTGARSAFQLMRPTEGEHLVLGYRILVRTVGSLGGLALAGNTLDGWDITALEQGVAALALEVAKEQAVKAAESRVRGDLLRTILSGAPANAASLQSQAAEMGFDLQQPHVAVVCEPVEGTVEILFDQAQRLCKRRHVAAPLMSRDDGVVIFCPMQDAQLARSVVSELHNLAPLTAGISNVVTGLPNWPHAVDEAEQALALGRQLFGANTITPFSELGVYRLLLAQQDQPELWRFYHETLGALVEHDRDDGELVSTLEGYFAELGNVSRAAERLHIHRNTLIYRLQRISEIIGIDWKHAEDQLALQLALKAHRVLKLINDQGQRSVDQRVRQ